MCTQLIFRSRTLSQSPLSYLGIFTHSLISIDICFYFFLSDLPSHLHSFYFFFQSSPKDIFPMGGRVTPARAHLHSWRPKISQHHWFMCSFIYLLRTFSYSTENIYCLFQLFFYLSQLPYLTGSFSLVKSGVLCDRQFSQTFWINNSLARAYLCENALPVETNSQSMLAISWNVQVSGKIC